MRAIIKALSFILFSCLSFEAYAQDEAKCQEIDNKKAVKLYEQGIDKKYKKEERLIFLQEAMKWEPDYVDANFAFAMERIKTLSIAEAKYKPVEPYLKKVIEICPKYHSDPYYYLGFIAWEDENYDDCAKYLKLYIDFKDDDEKKFNKEYDALLKQARDMVRYAKVYSDLFKNKVPFDPKPVAGICTEKDEYLPIISSDDEMMLFTRKQPYVNKDMVYETDKEMELFSYAMRSKTTGEFNKGQRMPYPFNKDGAEGGATMSIDNKHVFFTRGKDEGGAVLNFDIYTSDNINGEWTEAKKVEGINDPVYWDSQPSIASDGKTLYFASDRKGGRGGVDLYVTVKDFATGVWSPPVNMGPVINTSYDEKSAFIHSDFQTIYFSSDGHPGVGGFDIFFSKKGEDGKWGEPKNIGIPINTPRDDLGFFVSTDGHLGYFSSNEPSRANGKSVGKHDVYSFDLYKEARPDEVAFFKGKIEDFGQGSPVGFKVEAKDVVTNKVTEGMVDTITGNYALVVNTKTKNDLIITVKKDNYAFSSQLVKKDSLVAAKPVKRNLQVDTIQVGKTYLLNNIYYKTNSADLDPSSAVVISEFSDFLKLNPTLKIEVRGHTDNVGDAKSNLALSTDRAFSVRDLLISKGIEESRLVNFKGYGALNPIADNGTEAGRAKNRRTEFVIVDK